MAIYRGKNRLSVTILTDKEDDLNTELTEQEEKLDLLEAEVEALPIDPPSQDKTVIPSSEQQVIIADDGFKLGSVTVEPQVTHTEKLTEQKLLLTELKADVNALEDKPKSDVQYMIDQTNSCRYLFYYYDGTDLPFVKNLDTSNVTNMGHMFMGCNKLISLDIGSFNTSNVTDMSYMFEYCRGLTTLDLSNFNTEKVTTMLEMFYECSGLTSLDISSFDTSNVKTMQSMFIGCKYLKVILGELDMYNVTNTSSMFWNCTNLENVTLKNIRVNISFSNNDKISNDTLINTIQELWDLTGSTSQKLTLSTTSKNNIANIYVKLITPTAEQIEADPYINNKKPCEVCESTDDGAMLITEYLVSKNWSLA